MYMYKVCFTFLSTDPLIATSTTSVAQRRTVGTKSKNIRLVNKSWIILNKEDRTSRLNRL